MQVDLSDSALSTQVVAEYDGFVGNVTGNLVASTYFGFMQKAPDGRIYGTTSSTRQRYLFYINKPNIKGIACDVRQHAIEISLHANIPTFPNYRLGPIDGSESDSLGIDNIPVDHLESSAIFIPYIESLFLPNLTFAAPDVGSANRIREVASFFETDMVICDKHRKRANEIASMVVIGDVNDRDIVLIDDICDTGGTLAKSALLMKEKGARSVRAFCTHPVLSGKAYETINNSVLEELVVCDTIPLKTETEKIKVLSTDELFAVALRNAYENKSINSLFIRNRLRKSI